MRSNANVGACSLGPGSEMDVLLHLRPGIVRSLATSPNKSEIEGEKIRTCGDSTFCQKPGFPTPKVLLLEMDIKPGRFYWVLGRHASSRPLGEYVEKVSCF